MKGSDSLRLRFPAALVVALILAWPPATLAQEPADPFREAREHLNAGRADEVVAAVESVLEANPTDGDLHIIGSQLLREALRTELALAAARKAVSQLPDDPRARRQLARLMLDVSVSIEDPDQRMEAVETALAGFEEAAALAPDTMEYLVEWAEALVRTDRHEDAVGVWKRALALDGELVAAQIGLVRALAKLDRWEELHELASRPKNASPEMSWRVALYAYDEAASQKRYEIADSFLPSLRALAEGTAAELAVKALDAVANRPYDQALGWLAKYLAASPDAEEAEVVSNAVIDRGLGEIPREKRLPNRRKEPTAAGEIALPQLARKVEPFYPADLEARGVEGHVLIQAVVRTDGTIGRIKVLTSDHPHFTVSTLDAVKRWQYLPALQDGKPVAIYYTIRIDFRLKHGPPPSRKKK